VHTERGREAKAEWGSSTWEKSWGCTPSNWSIISSFGSVNWATLGKSSESC